MTDKVEPKDIIVVGAGIVGVCCGLFLQRDGHRVTIIDPRPPGTGTSFGNAGSIAVGSVYPVGTPGIWKRLPKMILDPMSPLSIRWPYLPRMTPWLWRFLLSSHPTKVEEISKALRALTVNAVDAHMELMRAHGLEELTRPVGWLKVYKSEESFAKTKSERDLGERRGLKFDVLNADEIRQLEPELAPVFTHAVHQTESVFVTSPIKLTEGYAEAFRAGGGQFLAETVRRFETDKSGVSKVVTDLGIHSADSVVIAAGAFSKRLTDMLGVNVLLDTERGYHLKLSMESGEGVRRPTYLGDHGFVLAPMEEGMRLTTGAELAGLDAPPNFTRIRRMLPIAREVLPGLSGQVDREWMGYRPSVPDSTPIIGRSPAHPNVYFGFGHGHIGLTLSARTGQILADMIAGRDSGIDLNPYRPERF